MTLDRPSGSWSACVALSVTRATRDPDSLFIAINSYKSEENASTLDIPRLSFAMALEA